MIAAALLWGSVGVTVGIIGRVAATNALVIGFLRLAIAGPAITLIHLLTVRTNPVRFAPRDWRIVVTMGAAMAAYQVTEFAAIPRLGVTRTILLAICTAPVFIALFAALALRELPVPRTLPPMAITLVGTALLVSGGATGDSTAPLVGVVLGLAAAASYAAFTVAGRAIAGQYPPTQSTAVAFSLGAVALLPFAAGTGAASFALGGQGWALIVLLGIVPTAFAYVLFLRGLRTVPAATAGFLSLLEPLGAAVLAMLLFGERLGVSGIVGAVLLLGGLAALLMGTGNR